MNNNKKYSVLKTPIFDAEIEVLSKLTDTVIVTITFPSTIVRTAKNDDFESILHKTIEAKIEEKLKMQHIYMTDYIFILDLPKVIGFKNRKQNKKNCVVELYLYTAKKFKFSYLDRKNNEYLIIAENVFIKEIILTIEKLLCV